MSDQAFAKDPTDLSDIGVHDPALYMTDQWQPLFARLRRDDPVHFTETSPFGAYWSITRYDDIMAVEWNDRVFSSSWKYGGTDIRDSFMGELKMFIRMDKPEHSEYRRLVAPIVGPGNLKNMTDLIRQRTVDVLDKLPMHETFDWVEQVSVPLTTMMLATLMDFPFDERHKLTEWSDIAVSDLDGPHALVNSPDEQMAALKEMSNYFRELYVERKKQPPKFDLISMLAHSDVSDFADDNEFIGTIILLIVGGNDTTRNSMSGSIEFLADNPDQFERLQSHPDLVDNLVPETIRFQTPIVQMRRTAREDTEVGGKKIKKGDKVVMWYVSGNRDEDAIDEPWRFDIERRKPRRHLSFGAGIHRCVGDRLAELQLKILWEEFLKRRISILEVGEPDRLYSNKIRGIRSLPVRLTRP